MMNIERTFQPVQGNNPDILPGAETPTPALDSQGFRIDQLERAQLLSLEAEASHDSKPLNLAKLKQIATNILQVTLEIPPKMSWRQMVIIDAKYLYKALENQFTCFRVTLFALVALLGQNVIFSFIVSWLVSPEGRDFLRERVLSSRTVNFFDTLRIDIPILDKIPAFKEWMIREDLTYPLLKMGLKTTFVAANILFKAAYDIATIYPILMYINSGDPPLILAGFLIGSSLFQADYKRDLYNVKNCMHGLAAEHIIYPIDRVLPDNADSDVELKKQFCTIRQGAILYPAKLGCNHMFDTAQIIREYCIKPQCPICRKPINNIQFDAETYNVISQRCLDSNIKPVHARTFEPGFF